MSCLISLSFINPHFPQSSVFAFFYYGQKERARPLPKQQQTVKTTGERLETVLPGLRQSKIAKGN